MTKAALEEGYAEQGRSLSDLAKQFGCTRQYVFKRLLAFGIPRRTLSQARCAALERGKVVIGRGEGPEGGEGRTLERRHVDEAFFERWSPEMAWVLGVIVSDGCLSAGRIRVVQKEPELLEKVRSLLRSTHPIALRRQSLTPTSLHTISIYSRRMFDSLLELGVTPKKSRTILFPNVPDDCLRHFIRGCWDGDGSIMFAHGNPACPRAHYVSGSELFMEGMAEALRRLGLPAPTVYRRTTSWNPVWTIVIARRASCALLYSLFYDDVPASMYLERKHDGFLRAYRHFISLQQHSASEAVASRRQASPHAGEGA